MNFDRFTEQQLAEAVDDYMDKDPVRFKARRVPKHRPPGKPQDGLDPSPGVPAPPDPKTPVLPGQMEAVLPIASEADA